MATDDRRLSDEWSDLQEAGEVPDRGAGATAERTERDKKRKRKRMPAEDHRQGRKVTPTLSPDLVRRLRAVCKAEGYVGSDGDGVIASSVIEDLLTAAVEAYERGEFEEVEEVMGVRRRLKRRPQQ